MRRILCGAVALCGACVSNDPASPNATVPAEIKSSVSGQDWGEWSAPVNLTVVNSTFNEVQPMLSPDKLSLYFASSRPPGVGPNDFWVSRRASLNDPWSSPVHLGPPLSSAGNDAGAAFSPDGHWIFFHSSRAGGYGATDIYVSHRKNVDDDFNWEPAENLGPLVNTAVNEAGPFYLPQSVEGRGSMYFVRGDTPSSVHIYTVALDRDWHGIGPAVPVSELNVMIAGIIDAQPRVARDGKEIYFFSNRAGGLGLEDLYTSTRRSVQDPWSPPANMGSSINTAFRDAEPAISLDGSTLLFASGRPGTLGERDIYVSTRSRPGNR